MTEHILKERTQELLSDPLLGSDDLDAKVLRLLEAEYVRKMAYYQRVRQTLEQKYSLTFEEFIAQDIVAARDYDWEVEQDAMDWETAIGGIATIERRLSEVRSTLTHCCDQ